MKPRLIWGIAAVTALIAASGSARAQVAGSATMPGAAPTALTIDQAVALAQHNNPDFLTTRNNARNASLALRSAYGGLLPTLSASLTGQYQQGGQQFFNGVSLSANSDVMQSQYNIGLNYRINAATFIAPKVQRANVAAVDADIAGAKEALAATVRQDYLTALQSRALTQLNDSLVANAQVQLELARAKAQVGTGTLLDVQRAEVALGQQQVALLQARNQNDIDKLRLFQQMGVAQPADVELVTTFSVSDSLPPLPDLLAMAKRQNPGIVALRSREDLANLTVKSERTEYTPTLTLSTGIGGYTYQYRDPNFLVNQAEASTQSARSSCVATQEVRQAVGLPNTLSQCANLVFTPAMANNLRAQNSQFPFSFTPSPRSISAQISLPIFDGFAREQRVQQAVVTRENARYNVRARELALQADVSAAYLSLQTAKQTVALQEQNSAKAKQELQFVQDQYAVGLATFVDLTTSRAAYAQAENDRINAIYNYHKAVAALESAVGRPLR
ncbi:MAG TPA: TolC family protein [Gemmatimonadaceae bacterium]|nr:TolC family protein [Gemmatimonadaceae bacterium]